jgi:hypothetical protein
MKALVAVLVSMLSSILRQWLQFLKAIDHIADEVVSVLLF